MEVEHLSLKKLKGDPGETRFLVYSVVFILSVFFLLVVAVRPVVLCWKSFLEVLFYVHHEVLPGTLFYATI